MKKAIILAGGKGTRLMPLTENTPKPLIPILGKSIILRILDHLSDEGVEKALITTMYLPEKIKSIVGVKHKKIDIEYFVEKTPLGTSGALKHAKKILDISEEEDFLVVSGDCMCDFSISDAYIFHKIKNADATILTKTSDNPLEYGIVMSDSDSKIYGFNEKPPWSQVTTDAVNTGVYIIKGNVIDILPEGASDFSKDLFPQMLGGNMRLYEYKSKGYWCDIGSISSYRSCTYDALNGRIQTCKANTSNSCYISEDITLEPNVNIGENCVIGSGCYISSGTNISNTIIFDNVTINKDCEIYGAIICDSVNIPRKSIIGQGSIITETKSISEIQDAKKELCFTEDGIIIEDNYKYCFDLACSVAACCDSFDRVGVMYSDGRGLDILSDALLGGIGSMGLSSYSFDEGSEKLAEYCALHFFTDLFLYLHKKDDKYFLKIFDTLSLAPSREFERKLASVYSTDSYAHAKNIKSSVFFDQARFLYFCSIINTAKETLQKASFWGMNAAFVFDSFACSEAKLVKKAFLELGGTVVSENEAKQKSYTIIYFNKDNSITACQSNYALDRYHITASVLKNETNKTAKEIALPYVSPDAYKVILESADSIVFYPMHSNKSRLLSENVLKEHLWLRDENMLCIKLLAIMHKKNANISQLYSELPQFAVSEKYYNTKPNVSASQIVRKLTAKIDKIYIRDNYEGVRISYPQGNATIIPLETNLIKIITEAANSETADELYTTLCNEIDI